MMRGGLRSTKCDTCSSEGAGTQGTHRPHTSTAHIDRAQGTQRYANPAHKKTPNNAPPSRCRHTSFNTTVCVTHRAHAALSNAKNGSVFTRALGSLLPVFPRWLDDGLEDGGLEDGGAMGGSWKKSPVRTSWIPPNGLLLSGPARRMPASAARRSNMCPSSMDTAGGKGGVSWGYEGGYGGRE